jgi:hypothetical protein
MSAPEEKKHSHTPSDRRIGVVAGLVTMGAFILILILIASGTSTTPTRSVNASYDRPASKSTPAPGTTTSPTNSASPSDSSSNGSSAMVNTPAPPPSCATYQTLDSQSWLEIVKDPNAYQDNCYTVYGDVTQFDSVTGTSSFFADVGGVAETPEYGFVSYPTLTYLTGDSTTLQTVVQQDLFTANVMVVGTETYKTVTGAQLTVPALQVYSIQVTGTAAD